MHPVTCHLSRFVVCNYLFAITVKQIQITNSPVHSSKFNQHRPLTNCNRKVPLEQSLKRVRKGNKNGQKEHVCLKVLNSHVYSEKRKDLLSKYLNGLN